MQSGAPSPLQGNLNIDTGVRRISINGDLNNIIAFNPSDVAFGEKFYKLMGTFDEKYEGYKKRAAEIDANTEKDVHGVPKNFPEGLAMMREIATFMRAGIDDLFGEGVSQKLFGEAMDLTSITQFLEGITPYIKAARVAKVGQYAPPNPPPPVIKKNSRKAHKVMR